MSEERLDRIERHVEQLIQMVAENNQISKEMVTRMDGMETRMGGMETQIGGMDTRIEGLETGFAEEQRLNRKRHEESRHLHKELLKEARSQNVDIGYLRDKVAEHDMEIHRLNAAVN